MTFLRSTRGGVRLTLSQPYPFSLRAHGALLFRFTTLCLATVPAGAALFSAPAAHAKDRLNGVWGWTTGNPHTYVRARPDFSAPPVGKLPLRTPVMLWGKFGPWYRVETSEHVFGWIDAQYVVSRDLYMVATLSKWKADEASDRAAGLSLAAAAAGAASNDQYAAAQRSRHDFSGAGWQDAPHQRIRLAANIPLGEMHPAPAASDVSAAAKGLAEAVDAATSAAPSSSVPSTPPAPALAVAPSSTPNTPASPVPVPSASLAAPGSPGTLPAVVTPTPAGPTNVTPVSPVPAIVTPVTPNPVTPAPAVPAPVVVRAISHPAPHAVHAVAWHKWTPKPVVHWTPVAKWAPRHAWRPAYSNYWVNWRAYKRQQLRKEMGIAPQPIVPVALPPVTIAPVSPADLLRAREDYLNARRAKFGTPGGPTAVASADPAVAPAAPSGTSVSTPASPAAATPTSATGANAGAAGSGSPTVASASANAPAVSGTADEAAHANTSTVAGAVQPITDSGTNDPAAGQPAAAPMASAPQASPAARTIQLVAPFAVAKPVLCHTSLSYRGGSPRDRAVYRGGSPRQLANARLGQGLANQAEAYRGMPYIRGAASPSRGFDCSGLVYFLLRRQGFNPPRTAAGYANFGSPVARGTWKPGDLLLFSNTYKRGISHIGVYMGNGKFVHASTPGAGVRVDSLFSGYYSTKYSGARRIP